MKNTSKLIGIVSALIVVILAVFLVTKFNSHESARVSTSSSPAKTVKKSSSSSSKAVKKDKKNMNQNQVKLIAIDMDGTLLNSQKEIPEENIKAIQEATAAGIKIVLCTGRPRSGIVPHFEKLGLSEEEYIIMNNGCSTYETKNWTLLESKFISF